MNKEDFNRLVQDAREADLVDYFRISGYTLKKYRTEYYVEEIPGLCINPSEKKWCCHYATKKGGGIEGRINNSIDCLTELLGMSFNQAVLELTGRNISTMHSYDFPKSQAPEYTSPPVEKLEKIKRMLEMPPPAQNMRRLFAYLCKTRKIPVAIVEELVHSQNLYQSQKTERLKGENAVFIHKNAKGEIIGGEIQGITSFKRFKGVVAGTRDSVFMFTPYPAKDGKLKRAYLFESAIDLMSFYSFCDKKNKLMRGTAFISMAGLKPTIPKKLQSEGVEIISCVDNDNKGRQFESDNGFVRSESVKKHLDYQGFKDWNELLVFQSENKNLNLMENQQQKNLSLSNLFKKRGGNS